MKEKVLIAMSGGVDSSVAAALLKNQGYDLVGVTMNLACVTKASEGGCCSASAAHDAKKVADLLGFQHYTLNYKDEFKREVIDNFIDEYKNGRTPNPCIRCNQFIKFPELWLKAQALGCQYLATGHYSRIEPLTPNPFPLSKGEGARGWGCRLLKGKDGKKDQSYVLYRLNQEILSHTLFPLGGLKKTEVRAFAKQYNLTVAEKAESQEICFIEDDDYGRYLKENVPEAVRPGKIVDAHGHVLGEHQGVAFYTIGQRKGIGHHRGNPKYVIGIDVANNQVIIGDDNETLRKELTAKDVTFISGRLPTTTLAIRAKIRYNSTEAAAELIPQANSECNVRFQTPQRAVTPGQSVVFYDGNEVLGGGIISG